MDGPWTGQRTANANISEAYTYVLAQPLPDTPPVSGSNAPSQRRRSAWWNRPVGNRHISDSETVARGPSALRSPPDRRVPPSELLTGKRLKAASLCLS